MGMGTRTALLAGGLSLLLTGCGGEGGFFSGIFGGGDETVTSLPMAETPPELAAISGQPLPQGPGLEGRREWSGATSAAFNDLFVTARDDRGWRLIWQLVGQDPPGPLPSGSMGLGVFLGMRPSAGYLVDVTDTLVTDDDVVAVYEETKPLAGAMTAEMLTAPWTVELVSLSDLPVHFREAP